MLTALFFVIFVILTGGAIMFLLARIVESNRERREKNNKTS